MKKSQASMEYLMVVGLVFVIIVPMVYLFYDYSTSMGQQVSEAKVAKIGSDIVNAAEEVFYLGPPSKTTIKFDLPQGIYKIATSPDGKELVFYTGTFGEKEVVSLSNVNLRNYFIPTDFAPGKKSFRVEAKPDYVAIYSGQYDVAVLLWSVYQMAINMLANAAAIGQPVITQQADEYFIAERSREDTAYISGEVLPNTLLKMNVSIASLNDGDIRFWVTDDTGSVNGEATIGDEGSHQINLTKEGQFLNLYINEVSMFSVDLSANAPTSWHFGDDSDMATNVSMQMTDISGGGTIDMEQTTTSRVISIDIPDNVEIQNISVRDNTLVFNVSDIHHKVINGTILAVFSQTPISNGDKLSLQEYPGRDLGEIPLPDPVTQYFVFTQSGGAVNINVP